MIEQAEVSDIERDKAVLTPAELKPHLKLLDVHHQQPVPGQYVFVNLLPPDVC